MRTLEIWLEQSLPKRPLNKDQPKQILRTVHFANTGRTMTLKKFCAWRGISYQGCREQIDRHPGKTFMQIVSEMQARAKRKLSKSQVHDCPHCRCVRSTEEVSHADQNPTGQPSPSLSTGDAFR